MIRALCDGDVGLVENYLIGGVDPNFRDIWGDTPMHFILDPQNLWGREDTRLDPTMVRLLLVRGGNPFITNKLGIRPIDLTNDEILISIIRSHVDVRSRLLGEIIRYFKVMQIKICFRQVSWLLPIYMVTDRILEYI